MTALGGGKATLRWGLPAAALLAILLLPGRAAATTFSPTTTADGDNGGVCGATCTLRDAINAATAAPGNDVSIPAGRYTLSLGELLIDQNTTVAGAGARTTTIDAQGTSRVLDVSTGIVATIRDLTITGGAATIASPPLGGEGGGILNQGTLRLQKSAVVGNTADTDGGGVSAPLKGPGLSTIQTITTIEDSLISANRVTGGGGTGSGGGLQILGDATVVNSTVTGNTVSNAGANQGGGIVNFRQFLSTSPGSLTLLNTTVAGNSAVGAGGVGGGLVGDSTDTGPDALSNLTARNTIIAGNTAAGAAQDCFMVNVVSTAFNLSGDATCGFTDAGSRQSANPLLLPLANNGGPTNTMAIADGSPALNTGTNSGCPAVDQRGTTRPQVVTCDKGAFEAKPPDLVVEQRAAGKRKKKKKKRGLAAIAAGRGGKKVVFVATVTNKGEQAAPGTKLTVKPPKKGKVKLSGCDSVSKQKRKKKGKGKGKKSELKRKRKRRKQALICSLGTLGSGASRTVRIKIPPKGKPKVVSRVSVSSAIVDADPTNDSARTKVRVKRAKPRR